MLQDKISLLMEDLQLSENTFIINSKVKQYRAVFSNDIVLHLTEQLNPGDYIIIDRKVADLYPELCKIFLGNSVYIQDSSEVSKSYEKIAQVLEQIVEVGFRRDNKIIAIGGGIVQDVASFISFILYRGVNWIYYPTNLLSQCDSCIGSKISINFGQYKNLLGGFYPPSLILININFLTTLKRQDILSGLGEMLHYFLVSSDEDLNLFFKYVPNVKNNLAHIDKLIIRSLEIKRKMIELDEFDEGPRHIFNYGHSFGHALESATDYFIPHGIAVSLGIDLANLVSVHLGFLSVTERNRIRKACEMVFGEVYLPNVDKVRYRSALMKDKKNIGSNLGLILSKGIGKMFKHTCSYEDISEVIEQFFENKTYLQSI
jgi:3-dehydroquinate synthase